MTLVVTGVVTGVVAGCTSASSGGSPPSHHRSVGATTDRPGPSVGITRHGTARHRVLVASLEPWHLRYAVSREVVFAAAGRLDVVGGLQHNGVTTAKVTTVDPATGVSVAAPDLARASHDAAGALVVGRPTIFGGGNTASAEWIQQRDAAGTWRVIGRLPTPRSDLTGSTIGTSAYVLGGYDGQRLASSVLRISRGARTEVVGHLRVPVRYAAVAAVGNDLWVVGGRTQSGPTDVVERFDLATGRASVSGHLATPLEGASAVVLGGEVYVCGGVVDRAPSTQVLRLDPSTGRIRPAGRLPAPVSYAGAAELGGSAYLVGGELPAVSANVIRLRLTAASARGKTRS